jgi:Flp pilus assembly protein TadG
VTVNDIERRRGGSQRGVTAVVVAISIFLLAGAGALGFDISRLVFARQQLRNAVDAAAQAVAVDMPVTSASAASLVAKNFAMANDPNLTTSDIQVSYFCVVAKASDGTPTESQIPGTCNPGISGHDWLDSATDLTGKKQCPTASTVCAIPCVPSTTIKCNAVQVTASRVVQFIFGRAIGIPTGSTGAISTISCRGTCGGEAAPNPMDVVVMADRTGSMLNWSGSDVLSNMKSLRDGISSMLTVMDQRVQYVAMGAIHKSNTTSSNPIAPLTTTDNFFTKLSNSKSSTTPASTLDTGTINGCNAATNAGTGSKYKYHNDILTGTWVPVDFSNSYLNTDSSGSYVLDSSGSRTVKTGTNLQKSITNLPYSVANWNTTSGTSSYCTKDGYDMGTHLAAALKGGAQYLTTSSNLTNNISAADLATRDALGVTPKKVLILETDGQPGEKFTNVSADGTVTSLSNTFDIGNTNLQTACDNFQKVADNAKAAGITVITIGFGAVTSGSCGSSTSISVLASVASTKDAVTGHGDVASGGCSTTADVAAENSDSDYFFCAASGADLATVFTTAMGQLSGSTKFMSIDGFGD